MALLYGTHWIAIKLMSWDNIRGFPPILFETETGIAELQVKARPLIYKDLLKLLCYHVKYVLWQRFCHTHYLSTASHWGHPNYSFGEPGEFRVSGICEFFVIKDRHHHHHRHHSMYFVSKILQISPFVVNRKKNHNTLKCAKFPMC